MLIYLSAFIVKGDWTELKVTSMPSPYLPFEDFLYVRFNGLIHNQSYINVVVTPSRMYLQHQEKFYYFQFSVLHKCYFYRCNNQLFDRFTHFKDFDESVIAVHCERIATLTEQVMNNR